MKKPGQCTNRALPRLIIRSFRLLNDISHSGHIVAAAVAELLLELIGAQNGQHSLDALFFQITFLDHEIILLLLQGDEGNAANAKRGFLSAESDIGIALADCSTLSASCIFPSRMNSSAIIIIGR